jgi:hypothetical protein
MSADARRSRTGVPEKRHYIHNFRKSFTSTHRSHDLLSISGNDIDEFQS